MPFRSFRGRLYLVLIMVGAAPLLLLVLGGLTPLGALLGLPLLGLLLYPLAAALSRPLEQLTDLARRIEAGESQAGAVLEPGTEWALLGRVMADLAVRLERVSRSLEQQVAERTAALSRKADQLRAVGQVGQQVASVLEPEALLHFVTRVMRGTFGYDLVAVLQRHGDHLVLTACAAKGLEEVPLGRAFPIGTPTAPPLAGAVQGDGGIGQAASPLLASLAAGSEMAVPIRMGQRELGVMVVQSLNSAAFDREDLFTARTIAGQVAVALENARLFEAERQLRDLAITDERNRMAREIHDTLAQGFMGIIMQLRAMQAAADPETARFHRETAEALARESLQEARRSVWNLRPGRLEGRGLAAVLADEVAGLERHAALRGRFEARGQVEALQPAQEAGLLRVAQEALHNAVKHAHASQVEVCLARTSEAVELTIADDGIGFDPARVALPGGPGAGFGLSAMVERVRLLGGELSLQTAPGEGCRVIVRIPVKGRS